MHRTTKFLGLKARTEVGVRWPHGPKEVQTSELAPARPPQLGTGIGPVGAAGSLKGTGMSAVNTVAGL